MADAFNRALVPWLRFAGVVLVVAVLYWAQAVLVPVALALLITFVLTPPVMFLQRWIGRVTAVLVVVALVFTVLGLASWGVATQMANLANELPRYRTTIREKIADVRKVSRGGSVEQVEQTVKEIQKQIDSSDTPAGNASQPVIVQSQRVTSLTDFPSWLGPALGPLSTGAFVIALVIFMLLEREELRGRVIGLVGHGNMAVTTRAFDEAGSRVSRQLLMQTVVNILYGVQIGLGLWWIGTPYPLLWAAIGAALRFVPYLGPLGAAAGPIFISFAALPGWTRPLYAVGLLVVVEIITNLVLETVLYAGAAGVSQVALLVAVATWTWLWGSMGLLLATPLTVCLVVLGKHVPGLDFVSTLMADSPALSPPASYYQRLLAHDQSEAAELVRKHLSSQPADTIFDALMLPALNYAERDRVEERLSDEEERSLGEQTRELLDDVPAFQRAAALASSPDVDAEEAASEPAAPVVPVEVLAYPANGQGDEIALEMLAQLLDADAIRLDMTSARLLASEIIELARARDARLVCIADLPPSSPSKTRYLVKKLHDALPDARILVGRWAPPELADEDRTSLVDAGATHVATTLIETRDQLRSLAGHERQRIESTRPQEVTVAG